MLLHSFLYLKGASETMDYKIGDKVVYPNHGVGLIEQINYGVLNGKTERYFMIRIVSSDLRVMVPQSNAESVGLRSVMRSNDTGKVLGFLERGKLNCHHDWKHRFKENSERMRTGSLLEVAAAEGNETLEDDSNFEEGPGAHTLRVFLEAVLPVVMRVKFAGFEKAQDFAGFRRTNDGTKANGRRVRLRNHNTQAAGNNADHEVTFGSAVQNSVTDLFNNAHTMIRVDDFVADLLVHQVR